MKLFPNASIVLTAVTLLFPGCGGSLGGNPEKSASAAGSVRFSISDAPVDDAASVFVSITAIEVFPSKGSGPLRFDLQTEEIDLLSYRNGRKKQLLDNVDLPVGDYSEIRLVLSDAHPPRLIDKEGQGHNLKIPSGSESGLKIKSPFARHEGLDLHINFDFDLRKSIHEAGQSGKFIMKPVVRMAVQSDSGAIRSRTTADDVMCIYQVSEEPTVDCMESLASTSADADGTLLVEGLSVGAYKVILIRNSTIVSSLNSVTVQKGKVTGVEFPSL